MNRGEAEVPAKKAVVHCYCTHTDWYRLAKIRLGALISRTSLYEQSIANGGRNVHAQPFLRCFLLAFFWACD